LKAVQLGKIKKAENMSCSRGEIQTHQKLLRIPSTWLAQVTKQGFIWNKRFPNSKSLNKRRFSTGFVVLRITHSPTHLEQLLTTKF
jgi:hypothetical protein